MIQSEQIAFNNGMVIGMATKGLIKGDKSEIKATNKVTSVFSSYQAYQGSTVYSQIYYYKENGDVCLTNFVDLYNVGYDGQYAYPYVQENKFNAIREYQGKFYLSAYRRELYTTLDGTKWTYEGITPVSGLIALGDNKILISNGGLGSTCYSNDINLSSGWTPMLNTIDQPTSIVYGNGVFVASTTSSSTGGLYYTSDLVTWNRSLSSTATSKFTYVIFDGNRFIAAAYSSTNPIKLYMYVSDDGITWTSILTNINEVSTIIVHGNGKYLIKCPSSVSISNDLIIWTKLVSDDYPTLQMYDIGFTGDKFIATGSNVQQLFTLDESDMKLKRMFQFPPGVNVRYIAKQ